jgi:hypothetical protein
MAQVLQVYLMQKLALNDKGKPSERVGRKATGLSPMSHSLYYLTGYGGWVAEVGDKMRRLILCNALLPLLLMITVGVCLLDGGLQGGNRWATTVIH